MYVISVASDLAGVHPQTLRLYERRGLLDPSRTAGGSRRYSDADIDRLRRIGDLTEAGVNLEGVRRILELEDEVRRLHTQVAAARDDADRQMRAVEAQYRRDLVPLSSGPLVPVRPPTPRARPHRPADVITQQGPSGPLS